MRCASEVAHDASVLEPDGEIVPLGVHALVVCVVLALVELFLELDVRVTRLHQQARQVSH